ncbi:U3 ribonucleoprotein (Utp) family protein [Raphanus sativus]|nr:U3 ribonucleoprotein (Utp) family protein [Raphanus sativus]
MLQALTGMPSAAFNRESKSKPVLFTEAYPEGEFNPTRDVLEGKNVLTEEDLLAPLEGKPGYHKTSRQISRMRKDTKHVVHSPLPKPQRERLERKAVKGLVDEEFSKWVHLVKKNREATTVYFNQDVNLGNSTVSAIASEFRPRTEFEMRMASVLNDDHEVSVAHREDGPRLVDHVKDHNHTAKMRSLLFRHERKSKQFKKIKSKLYHRLKNKDLRNSALGALMDPELAKEEAMKQEARRVEERMTSKHKNKGKWAKRMRRLGLDVKYDGTRAAIAEQLQMNANLSRKMNSMRDGSSSDESDDDEEELNEDTLSKLIAKAKEKTMKALEDDEVLNSGLMSLPFLARAMKKKNEEANEQAKRALVEYEEWETSGGAVSPKKTVSFCGRRVFGATEAPEESKKDSDSFYDNSDSDNNMNSIDDARDIASPSRTNTGTITETEVSLKESRDEMSEDSESQMVDGIFEIPCQAELINRAFAGDDVVDEFYKDKQEVLNQEVPEPVKPVLLPGWGPWINKRGYHHIKTTRKEEYAQKERAKDLKTRKDARLKHVIISEKVDKKAEKLHTETPPFPYTSKEVFEHSMRMPIGPEFNPSTIVGDLNRAEVVKKTGVIIKPVKFEEVDDEHTRNHQKPRLKKKTGRRQSKAK